MLYYLLMFIKTKTNTSICLSIVLMKITLWRISQAGDQSLRDFCRNSNLILSIDELLHTDPHTALGKVRILYRRTTVSDHIPFTLSIENNTLPAVIENIVLLCSIIIIILESLIGVPLLRMKYARTYQSLTNIPFSRDAVIYNNVKCCSVELEVPSALYINPGQ